MVYAEYMTLMQKSSVEVKTGLAIYVIGQLLLIFGHSLFSLFGFTIDTFRIGVWLLLFLNAVDIMNGNSNAPPVSQNRDISVVQQAIPLGMEPATIGAVMILGAASASLKETIFISACLLFVSACTSTLLWIADRVRRILRETGIEVMI